MNANNAEIETSNEAIIEDPAEVDARVTRTGETAISSTVDMLPKILVENMVVAETVAISTATTAEDSLKRNLDSLYGTNNSNDNDDGVGEDYADDDSENTEIENDVNDTNEKSSVNEDGTTVRVDNRTGDDDDTILEQSDTDDKKMPEKPKKSVKPKKRIINVSINKK